LALLDLTAGFAPGAARSQGTGRFAAPLSAALDVEGLVERFVDHVRLRPPGELCPQNLADLLRAPQNVQVGLDEVPQFGVLADLAGLGSGPADICTGLGRVRAVLAARRVTVRRIPRLTVDGPRPSSAAIARSVAFSRSRSAMWMRSSSRGYRDGPQGAATALIGGSAFRFPYA
jgi:hypothetical protein